MPATERNVREIGYWVRAYAINQGIATETAGATRIGFEFLGLDRVEIHCDGRNVRSAAVPRKLGFVHDGNLRRRAISTDGAFDSMIWTMFADQYPASPAAQIRIDAFDVLDQKIVIGGV